ncbi:LysR family transcriptional regulator [Rhizobium leguminosarum]|jgi:DNA-binding transcriptional LysR family regulator|uniref:LysR family transcriptional regulator n=3 Tax=Rhizobium TaxID=379 RepID=A0ABZ0ZHE5_9HYPH|nr:MULTISPECIES: LysR family transcriptional regulator [Rhizobium]MDH6657415.1 DNA-binding transcriptional LysR family regulator [Rhizobium sophorae]ASS56383.1 LysR family transcriptional regulator [Rhizobium leguminosarum bv. viciae]AVC50792.1 lysR substrate binding domain protein [Rhizobium leguminosarum bv. viciae]MBB4326578.1 DNA-binding transcriptional LysR family regulator [Rhizobium leguminosarum]MBB4339077.1 DNA-binding transcriptional LysR family regulator [Rhizobium leguminosarum]
MNNLPAVDLNLLVAFDAIMAERSVTRAGARIGRTQPAMSAALARLRQLFQDELFVRSPSGLEPTPRALDLAEPIGKSLRHAQEALAFSGVFDPRSSSASFRLGLSEHPAFVLLPKLLAAIRQAAPNISIDVKGFIAREKAVEMLDAGEVDAAVGVPVSTSPRILSRLLFEESFVSIVRADHPAAARGLDLDTFVALDHLLVSPEGDRYGHVDRKLSELGLRRRLGLTLPQMYAAPAIVAETDLVATLMRGIVDVSDSRAQLSLHKPPIELLPVSFALSWHRRNDSHVGQQWFRELIGSVAAKKQDRLGESN